MSLNKRSYDTIKFLAQIVFPALGTLYFTIAGIWGLPAAEQVVGTIVAVDAFLGVLLQLSSKGYREGNAGDLVLTETGDKKIFSLELNADPGILEKKEEVTFRVRRD